VLVVVGGAADALMPKLLERIAAVKTTAGDEPGADMGPLVTRAHLERVRGYVDAGVKEGAELLADGRDLEVPGHQGGFFIGPCLFDRVKPEMSIYRDEIFGPVLCTVRVDSYAEAMELVARNPWGNGVALFTNDGGAARKFQQDVEVGMVGINVPIPGAHGLPLLRRLEALVVRRHPRARPRGHPLLHPPQGGHRALAGARTPRQEPRLPHHEVGRVPHGLLRRWRPAAARRG